MTSARPPGWYDDPSGDRSVLRWWDGRSWTSVTRDRAPSERLPEPVAAAAGSGSGDLLDSGHPPRPPVDRRRLVAAAIAVVVVALLAFTVLPGRRTADDGLTGSAPGPTAPPTATSEPAPAPTTARPVTGRVTDRVARLSYDVLPGDWREWDRDSFRGLVSTAGYYRITQERVPNGQVYWANVSSGGLDPVLAGGDLRTMASRLVDALALSYYPGHRRAAVSQRALTVDGAPAYLIRYRAVFAPQSAQGYTAKSEDIAVLLVETGAPTPSALYVSLPDTVEELWPAVAGLLDSVRVVR